MKLSQTQLNNSSALVVDYQLPSSFWVSRSLRAIEGDFVSFNKIDRTRIIHHPYANATFIAFRDTFLRDNPLLRMIVLECDKRDSSRENNFHDAFRIMTLISR